MAYDKLFESDTVVSEKVLHYDVIILSPPRKGHGLIRTNLYPLYSGMFCFPLFKDVLFSSIQGCSVFKLVNVSLFSPHEKKVS